MIYVRVAMVWCHHSLARIQTHTGNLIIEASHVGGFDSEACKIPETSSTKLLKQHGIITGVVSGHDGRDGHPSEISLKW